MRCDTVTSAFAVAALLAIAQAQDPSTLADKFVSRLAQESRIPGLAVGVVSQGRTVFARGYGFQRHGEAAAVDADTLFQMGSCTKTFIAMGLAHFVAQGKIDWKMPVSQITKGQFKASQQYLTDNINVGDLLAHRTGYGDHNGDLLWALGDAGTEMELVRQRVRALQPVEGLRERFMYSNIGFEIAAVTLEVLAGEPWYEFVQRTFFEPLGLNSTFAGLPALPPALHPKLSAGHSGVIPADYNASSNLPIIDSYDLLDPSTPSLTAGISNGFLGAGSALSSVNDYTKWLSYLLNSSAWPNATTVAQTQTAHMIVEPEWANAFMGFGEPLEGTGNALGAGFGFDVVGRLFHGERFFTKGGDSLFHQTRTGLLPGAGVGVVVFANMEGFPPSSMYVNGIRNALLQIFTGVPLAEVEAGWRQIQAQVWQLRQRMQALPVGTVAIPLRDGKNVSVTGKYLPGQTALVSKAQIETVLDATASFGLPPRSDPGNFTGSFHDEYYGTLNVRLTEDGRLAAHYGAVQCVLSALPQEASTWPFLCMNASKHTALFHGFATLVFEQGAWTLAAQAQFVRPGQRTARGASLVRSARLGRSPYLSFP